MQQVIRVMKCPAMTKIRFYGVWMPLPCGNKEKNKSGKSTSEICLQWWGFTLSFAMLL